MDENLIIETPIDDLRRVFINDTSDKFSFIVNFIDKNNFKSGIIKSKSENQIIIKTTINKARSISKKINEIYSVDPTIVSYEINYPIEINFPKINKICAKQIEQEKNKIENVFNVLLSSTTQDLCEISKDQKNIFYRIKYFLGEEVKDKESSEEENSNEQLFLIDNIQEAISLLSTQYHTQSIGYLANNFLTFIQSSLLKEIDESILKDIIDLYIEFNIQNTENKNMKKIFTIQGEIKEIFHIFKDKDEKELLIYFLLSLKMENFNEEMLEYLFNQIDDNIKSQDFSRLMFFIKKNLFPLFQCFLKKQEVDFDQVHVDCEYKEGEELNGIISYLLKEDGREILTNGTLTLTGGTDPRLNPYHPITNVTEYGEKINDYFYNFHSTLAPSEESNFIDFDFGQRKVRVTSYTIRSNKNNEYGRYHPKSWKICGSNDKENWDVLDHQLNCCELNGPYKQHRFICDPVKGKYRYIRYIQEDSFDSERTRSNFKYIIYLTCIEFFGEIY